MIFNTTNVVESRLDTSRKSIDRKSEVNYSNTWDDTVL